MNLKLVLVSKLHILPSEERSHESETHRTLERDGHTGLSEARAFLVQPMVVPGLRLGQLAVLTEQGHSRDVVITLDVLEGLLEAFEQQNAVIWFYVIKTLPGVRARSGRRGNATAGMGLGLSCAALHLLQGWVLRHSGGPPTPTPHLWP